MTNWYGVSSFIFGLVLFFPLRKFLYALSANRSTAKLKRQLTEEEAEKLKRKSYIIAGIIAVTFAFIYNKIIMIRFMGGIN